MLSLSRCWFRLLAALALLLGAFSAHAVIPATSGWSYSAAWAPAYTGSGFGTKDAACLDFKSKWEAGTGGSLRYDGWSGNSCDFYHGVSGTQRYVDLVAAESCPANSTSNGAGACTCNSGSTEQGGQCVVSQCAADAGKMTTLRMTVGYTRTGDDNDTKAIGPTFNPVTGGNVCSGGCSMQYADATKVWVSQAPTDNGLYRTSADIVYRNTGTPCTAGDNPADNSAKPDIAPPTCPGYVGEVNGKVGCFGTADKPVTPTALPQPSGQAPQAGNPPAGPVPASGPGSASQPTPSTGNGGPAGGPAGAATGGKGGTGGGTPSGTGGGRGGAGTTGDEATPCGATGQEKCNVKVDEAGTPTGGGTNFTGANSQIQTNADNIGQAINQAHGMTAPAWSFSFQLPTGCSAYNVNIKDFVMDPCQYQGTIHDLMSMIWCAVTAFCLISMVGRTIRES